MLRATFLILIFISWTSCSFAQKANKWAMGISYGYKLNNGAVEADYKIINKLTCNANLSLDKYMGSGLTTNTEAYVTNGPPNKTLLERINGYKKDCIVISVGVLYNF